MKRSFQEIYDFCKIDRTYNEYYNIPGSFSCNDKKTYRYYHASFPPLRVSRAGTFIFSQSRKQLDRFLKGARQNYHVHIHPETFQEVNHTDFLGETIYIVVHIRKRGVMIEFNSPLKNYSDERVCFIARSHRAFDKEGIIREVVNYIDKKLLYPPGRYRNLQLEYSVPKEKFVKWYKSDYLERQKFNAESEYWEMVEQYTPTKERISFEDSLDLLRASGAFFDFGINGELEQEELAEEFMMLCNR